MRLAQLMAGAAHGGAELFFERMTLALHRAGDAVLPVIRPEPARVARLEAAGLAPVGLRFGGPLDPFTRPRAGAALRRFGAEVAMAWMSRAAWHAPTGPWPLVGRLGGYYDLKYFRRCTHLVGNTRDIARWIEAEGWPRARVAYLPNFVDDFAADAPAVLDVPEGAPLVLGLGRLHEVKGFDTLIRAVAGVPGLHCAIAGEGPERGRLAALIAELGVGARVRLLGWRTDVGPLLKRADIFVCSSRHEPLGNMVLEAFSAGTPVVSTRAEGPMEVIRDGVDGVLAPVGDAGALAGALAGVARDPGGLGAAGRARYEAEFSEARVVSAWHEYFQTLKAG